MKLDAARKIAVATASAPLPHLSPRCRSCKLTKAYRWRPSARISFERERVTLSARRRVPHQLLDLGIQLARHGQRLRIAVGCEQACHLVVAEMHPIRPLIDQHRDWSVARGFRHMLRHVLHDQWIADQETLRLRRSETAFAAHHSTRIELHEQHSPAALTLCWTTLWSSA